jgi:hypothetical protein
MCHILGLEILGPPDDFGGRGLVIRLTPADLPKFLPYR